MVKPLFFDFPESRFYGTVPRLQKPRFIPILTQPNQCSLNVAMFSIYIVETRDQVIVLGQSRVSTFSRDWGKLKKWGPSNLIRNSYLLPDFDNHF